MIWSDKYPILLFFLLLLMSSFSHGQYKLTLKKAIQIAVEKNIEVEKAENDFKLENKRKLRSYSELFPTFFVTGSGNRSTGRNFDQVAGEVRTESGNFANAALRTNWDISNLLNSIAKLKASKHNSLSKLWGLENAKDFAILEVARNYFEILQNTEQREIFVSSIEAQEKNLESTEEQVTLGLRTKQDFYTQKAELSNLKSMLLQTENLISNGKSELIGLLRLEVTKDIELDFEFSEIEFDSSLGSKTTSELYEQALLHRNSIKSSEEDVKAKRNLLRQNRGLYYPSVSLFYNYGTNFSSFQEGDFRQQFFTDNITQVLGFSVNIPIFNGMQTRTSVIEAKITYENAVLDYESLKNKTFVEINNINNTIKANLQERTYRTDQQEASRIAFDLEQQKYDLGAGTPVTLAIAQRDYIEAQLLLNQAKYQLKYNQYELNFFCGTIQEKM
ncbi:TolC family protein [Spongiimicrobium salis]|uniref:TolC family protein n=1 Tax=Spongiimicrobium salis TaxID=1667022 RepID=UPI00374CB239